MDDAKQEPYLSIVFPAYNEEQRLPPTLERVAEFLRQQSFTSEVLVVENGSTDGTTQVVDKFISDHASSREPFQVRLLHSDKGKGNAVRCGVMAANGDYILVSDTDLAVPIEEALRLLPPEQAASGYGIAVASREVTGAVRHGEPRYRHVMGRVFNLLVRLLAVPDIQDTQCGFKCFSRHAAHTVFPLQRIDGWGFDVELMYIARRHGLRVAEIPVDWYYGDDSRVRPVQDTINMFADLVKIRRNGRAGVYDAPAAQAEELSAV